MQQGKIAPMDNLTHSLFGLAGGQLVQGMLPAEPQPGAQRTRGRMLLLAGWAASNFPDLDLVLTGLLPAPLGYLLHHRGHTHTLFYAIPQVLLLVALIWLLWPNARRLLRASRPARLGLALCSIGGMLLHIGFDFLNSYGVHPFHPFDGRWVYGDMVFILEPVFWIAFGVPLALSLRTAWLRRLLLLLLCGVAFFAFKGFLLWISVAALGLAALGMGWIGRRRRDEGQTALLAGMALAILFAGGQALSSALAYKSLAAQLAARPDHARLVDAALTAYPANPLCWSFASVERQDAAGQLIVRRGVLSVAPGLLPAAHCPAAMNPVAQAATTIDISWEHRASLAEFQRLAREDCHVAAWLRFARTPALFDTEISDARFGKLRANFSTLRLGAGAACPAGVPGWGMPRADLLAR